MRVVHPHEGLTGSGQIRHVRNSQIDRVPKAAAVGAIATIACGLWEGGRLRGGRQGLRSGRRGLLQSGADRGEHAQGAGVDVDEHVVYVQCALQSSVQRLFRVEGQISRGEDLRMVEKHVRRGDIGRGGGYQGKEMGFDQYREETKTDSGWWSRSNEIEGDIV